MKLSGCQKLAIGCDHELRDPSGGGPFQDLPQVAAAESARLRFPVFVEQVSVMTPQIGGDHLLLLISVGLAVILPARIEKGDSLPNGETPVSPCIYQIISE